MDVINGRTYVPRIQSHVVSKGLWKKDKKHTQYLVEKSSKKLLTDELQGDCHCGVL